jgi:hypothetical protein
MGDVLSFSPRISEDIDSTRIDASLLGHELTVDVTTSGDEPRNKRIATEDLYPLSHELRPELSVMFVLLSEGLKHVSDAIDMQNSGDVISSDDAIHRLQALLPELFCCRSISDGFGSIINAIYHSINNMHGNPLGSKQLHAVQRVLNRISTEPFLEYGEAVDEIMTLEDAGFEVEPSYYHYAADILDE